MKKTPLHFALIAEATEDPCKLSITMQAPDGQTIKTWLQATTDEMVADRAAALGWTPPASAPATALQDIAAERRRQVIDEGLTFAHDDTHANGQLAEAAACHALYGHLSPETMRKPPAFWPWEWSAWNPTPGDRRRAAVKAAALLVAEIERLDRAAQRARAAL